MSNKISTPHKLFLEALAANIILGLIFFVTEKIFQDSGTRYLFIVFAGITTLTILGFPRFKQFYEESATRRLKAQQELASPPLSLDQGDREAFHTRSFCHHKLMHHARDTALILMPVVPPYEGPPLSPGKKAAPLKSLELQEAVIQGMLQQMATIFASLVPRGTQVFTSLRDRRADDCYHTFGRAGVFAVSRDGGSLPLNKDNSPTVLKLKLSYQEGSCVVLTGSVKGPTEWTPSKNDRLGEDKCVLMGAVMTRSYGPQKDASEGWVNGKLSWIVSVCADRADAFTTQHIPLMQCFVITFSWLANTMIRNEHLKWRPDKASDIPDGNAV